MNSSLFGRIGLCFKKVEGQKLTLVSRILKLTIISVFVVLLVVMTYFSLASTRMLNENYEEQVENYSRVYSGTINQWTSLIRQQIENMAVKEEFVDKNMTMDEKKKALEEAASETQFTDFSISNTKGETYNDTNISERDYFQSAMSGETYISSPIVRKTDGSLTIMCGAKLRTKNYEGVIYGGIPVDFFSELVSGIQVGKTGTGFIVDSKGTIIADPDESIVRDQINPIEMAETDSAYTGLAQLVDAMTSGNSGSMTFKNIDGKEYVAGYYPVDGVEGWSIAVMIQKEETVIPLKNMLAMCILIAAGMFIICIIVSIILASGIALPVKVASDELNRIAKGDLSKHNINCKAKADETGLLLKNLEGTRESLSGYITEIDDILAGISRGNLDNDIHKTYEGDFVNIKTSLNLILDSLNKTFGDASNAAANLLEGARQVEMASQSLASASTEQASAIVQITSSIEGITKHVEENTADVEKTNRLAQQTKSEAGSGNAQMQLMIKAMNDINDSSQNIAKIMKVIDDIAFQTNILALNASVEAARAGVHGKGFAVVAEEVRNLAGKSADAAEEIAEMIDDSIKKIQNGTDIASDTAEKLSKIVSDVDEIAVVMDGVAVKSREQAESIVQINTGIEQISSAVQNNSATSEECAAASVELSGQAEGLMKQIKFYRLR